jgi:hypothetical protein
MLGATAVAQGVPLLKGSADPGRLRLKFGALSDIHITYKEGREVWERALRAYNEWKADGVLVCGDLTDWGVSPQLEWMAESWFKIFPGGKRSDGTKIANLLHYGDHDTSGYLYRHVPPCVKVYPTDEDMKKVVITLNDRKAIWERCFKEEWRPIEHKVVNGYDFVLSHFTKGEPTNRAGNNVPGLEDFLAKLDLDPNRPFFYSQHRIPRNSAGGEWIWGQDDGTSTSNVFRAKYPNCVSFCGHCHLNCAEEKAIWQDGFTCVQVPSLSYSVTLAGRDNGSSLDDRPPKKPYLTMPDYSAGLCRQGYFVSVYEREIVIRRWSFTDMAPVGPDWRIALPIVGSRQFSHQVRAENDPAPVFSPEAKVSVLREFKGKDRSGAERDMVELAFPTAEATSRSLRANDYEVQVELRRADVISVVATHRVYATDYGRGEKAYRPSVCCYVPKDEIPMDDQLVRFVVRPVNAFGRKGQPIATPFAPYRKPTQQKA